MGTKKVNGIEIFYNDMLEKDNNRLIEKCINLEKELEEVKQKSSQMIRVCELDKVFYRNEVGNLQVENDALESEVLRLSKALTEVEQYVKDVVKGGGI